MIKPGLLCFFFLPELVISVCVCARSNSCVNRARNCCWLLFRGLYYLEIIPCCRNASAKQWSSHLLPALIPSGQSYYHRKDSERHRFGPGKHPKWFTAVPPERAASTAWSWSRIAGAKVFVSLSCYLQRGSGVRQRLQFSTCLTQAMYRTIVGNSKAYH